MKNPNDYKLILKDRRHKSWLVNGIPFRLLDDVSVEGTEENKKVDLKKVYQQHLKNEAEHLWVETWKCILCGKYHESYLYEMNPAPYKNLNKQIDKLLEDS